MLVITKGVLAVLEWPRLVAVKNLQTGNFVSVLSAVKLGHDVTASNLNTLLGVPKEAAKVGA